MTAFAVITCIIIGVILIILEFLVFPGTAVAGIVGLILIILGIYLSYFYFDSKTGTISLIVTFVFVLGTIVYALRSKTWNKAMLHRNIEAKVDDVKNHNVKEGDEGVTISRLAPMGKVIINDEYYEAQANNELINEKTKIKVIKVLSTKVIVEKINT
jgi:membrane-bound ClpP family serine protease